MTDEERWAEFKGKIRDAAIAGALTPIAVYLYVWAVWGRPLLGAAAAVFLVAALYFGLRK